MSLFAAALALHVLVAILAVGAVGAIPLTAHLASAQADESLRIISTLVRVVQVGLLVMLVTGGLLDASVGGAFHRMGWFRISIAVLVLFGVALARVRAAVRDKSYRRIERWGWTMVACAAIITLLMQLKPIP